MKIDAALAFCLLCIQFKTLHGVANCSLHRACLQGNLSADLLSHSQQMDEFPKGNFTFHCPLDSRGKDFHMKLWNGQREVCTFYKDGKTIYKREEFCDVIPHNDRVSFILKNLKSKHSDTYTCCLEILSPFHSHCKAGEKHLYIEDSKESCLFSELNSWILVGVTAFCIVVCIFCLIVCCFRNVVCQRIQSSHEYNNEYMSMAAVKPS